MSRAWHAGPALSTGCLRATAELRQDPGVESQPLPRRRKPRRRLSRAQRTRAALGIAELHDGVAHRADLRTVGVTRADVRTEIGAGRWMTAGKHTVVIGSGTLTAEARHWQAVWESGSGAVLDGAAALVASGLSGFTPTRIDVSLPRNNRRHTVPGVVRHLRSTMPPACGRDPAGQARVGDHPRGAVGSVRPAGGLAPVPTGAAAPGATGESPGGLARLIPRRQARPARCSRA